MRWSDSADSDVLVAEVSERSSFLVTIGTHCVTGMLTQA